MIIEKGATWARFQLSGDVDLAWHEQYGAQLQAALAESPHLVILDMSEVTFLDSTGLWVIGQAYQHCVTQDGRVYVLHPKPFAVKTIEVAGLHELVNVVSIEREINEMYRDLAIDSYEHSGLKMDVLDQ